jgi:hypothetical protein
MSAPDETIRDHVRSARAAIDTIESGVDDLNSVMVELLWAGNLSEEIQDLVNDLGGEANRLFGDLNKHFERLCRELAVADDDDDDEGDEGDDDEDEAA